MLINAFDVRTLPRWLTHGSLGFAAALAISGLAFTLGSSVLYGSST